MAGREARCALQGTAQHGTAYAMAWDSSARQGMRSANMAVITSSVDVAMIPCVCCVDGPCCSACMAARCSVLLGLALVLVARQWHIEQSTQHIQHPYQPQQHDSAPLPSHPPAYHPGQYWFSGRFYFFITASINPPLGSFHSRYCMTKLHMRSSRLLKCSKKQVSCCTSTHALDELPVAHGVEPADERSRKVSCCTTSACWGLVRNLAGLPGHVCCCTAEYCSLLAFIVPAGAVKTCDGAAHPALTAGCSCFTPASAAAIYLSW